MEPDRARSERYGRPVGWGQMPQRPVSGIALSIDTQQRIRLLVLPVPMNSVLPGLCQTTCGGHVCAEHTCVHASTHTCWEFCFTTGRTGKQG